MNRAIYNSTIKPALLLASLFILAGCATSQPGRTADTSTISSVKAQPEQHQDEDIVWGGTVVGVENRTDETWIEIVGRPLHDSGVPDLGHDSNGRFLAIVPGFLDPVDYSNGRAITVTGTVDGSETRKIEEADYDYPVVAVADHQLWTNSQALAGASRYRSRNGYYGYPYRGYLSINLGHRFGSSYRHGYRYGRGYGFRSYGRFGYGGYGSYRTGRSRY